MALWYVDKDAVGTNAGTSWVNAWHNFGHIDWPNINAGDTIYISGGETSKTYDAGILGWDGNAQITPDKGGSAGNPITITKGVDANHNGTVILDGNGEAKACIKNTGTCSYITISHLTIYDHRYGIYPTADCTNWIIDSVICYGSTSHPNATRRFVFGGGRNNNTVITDCESYNLFQNDNSECEFINVGGTNIVMINVYLHDNEFGTDHNGDGFHFQPVSPDQITFTLTNCVAENIDGDGFDITANSGTLINCKVLTYEGNSAYKVWERNGVGTTGCVFVNCIAAHCIATTSEGGFITAPGSPGGIDSPDITLYGCVIDDVDYPIWHVVGTNTGHPNITVKNTIISNCSRGVLPATLDSKAVIVSDYNCWYNNVDPTPYSDIYTGQDTHSITGNPQFTNPATNDYTIPSGSPCKNAGVDLGASYDYDINNDPRPSGGSWDIGAYEFDEGTAQKWAHDDVEDSLLNFIKTGNRLSACNAQPGNYTEATSTYKLAMANIAANNFTGPEDANNGRKITVGQAGATVDANGIVNHIAVSDSNNSKLLVVTTCNNTVVIGGENLTFQAWECITNDPI